MLAIDFRFAAGIGAPLIAANAVATDPDGSTYLAGEFWGSAVFGPGTAGQITSPGGSDVFLAKYLPSGSLAWVKGFGGPGDDRATGIVSNGQGNVYLTGSFSATANFNPAGSPLNLTSARSTDVFIAKFDASSGGNGNCLWAYAIGGSSTDRGGGIALDSAGSVYVTGSFAGIVPIPYSSPSITLYSNGLDDIFVAAYVDHGTFAVPSWARQAGGALADTGSGIAVDPLGHVVVTGTFAGTLWVGGANMSVTSAGTSDNVLLAVFNASDGNPLWVDGLGGIGPARGTAVASDPAGNIYVAGSFSGTADFDPGPGVANLVSAGADDAFVAKYNSTGGYLWARQLGGAGSDRAAGLAFADGGIFVAGSFQGTAAFGPAPPGSLTLTSAGERDAFVMRLSSAGTPVWGQSNGGANDDAASAIAARDWSHVAIAGG